MKKDSPFKSAGFVYLSLFFLGGCSTDEPVGDCNWAA